MPISKLKASSIASGTIDNARISLDAAEIPALPTSKITSGTFDDARIAASNVSQHATSFDDNKLVNDLSTLGLRVHTQENLSASNTNSQYVDVFQDSSGYTNGATTARDIAEYVSAVTTGTSTITMNNSNYATYIDTTSDSHMRYTRYASGATSQADRFDPSLSNTAVFDSSSNMSAGSTIPTSDEATLLGHMFGTPSSATAYLIDNTHTSASIRLVEHVWKYKDGVTFRPNGTTSFRWRNGSGNFSYWELRGINHDTNSPKDGAAQWNDHQLGTHNSSVSNGSSYNFSVSQSLFYQVNAIGIYHVGNNSYMWDSLSMEGDVNAPQTNATGNFLCPAITAASSTTKMGAVITYQDHAGTNALNTDIVLQLSADNGSNFSTATLTALPDFSSGIKMAKVNDLPVTAGTQLKYKISFANQAAGSKVARIRGVSLNY